MKKIIELREKLAEARAKLDAELDNPDRNAESLRTATKLVRAVQVELDAAETAEEVRAAEARQKREDAEREFRQGGRGGDGETAEIRELGRRAQVVNHFRAALDGVPVNGVELEHNQARGLGGTDMHIGMLYQGEIERRATTDTDGQTNQMMWTDLVHAGTAADFLGIMASPVPAGQEAYPLVTAGAGVKMRGRGQSAADSAWTVGVKVAEPKRIASRIVFTERDRHRLPGLEEALIREMQMGIAEQIDLAVLKGNSTGDDGSAITGITGTSDIGAINLTQANKDKYNLLLQGIIGLVDGKFAMSIADIRAVWSVTTFKKLFAGVFTSDVDRLTAEIFSDIGLPQGRVRDSLGASDAASQTGAVFARQRMGLSNSAYLPVWENMELVRDQYSKSASGEIAVTMNSYIDFVVTRPGAFASLNYTA